VKEQKSKPDGVLYTTSGCHLCEQAEVLVSNVLGMTIRPVEIADDAELLERYGVRIPVLRRWDSGEELDWPFDVAAIRQWASNDQSPPAYA